MVSKRLDYRPSERKRVKLISSLICSCGFACKASRCAAPANLRAGSKIAACQSARRCRGQTPNPLRYSRAGRCFFAAVIFAAGACCARSRLSALLLLSTSATARPVLAKKAADGFGRAGNRPAIAPIAARRPEECRPGLALAGQQQKVRYSGCSSGRTAQKNQKVLKASMSGCGRCAVEEINLAVLVQVAEAAFERVFTQAEAVGLAAAGGWPIICRRAIWRRLELLLPQSGRACLRAAGSRRLGGWRFG